MCSQPYKKAATWTGNGQRAAFESPLISVFVVAARLGAVTMTGIEATVTTGASYPTFDRLSAGFGNAGQTDLDRLAASLDYLRLCCCKVDAHEADERPDGDQPLPALAMVAETPDRET